MSGCFPNGGRVNNGDMHLGDKTHGETPANPYRPQTIDTDSATGSRHASWIATTLFVASAIAVAVNYATATRSTIAQPTLFTHTVFWVAPFAIWAMCSQASPHGAVLHRRVAMLAAWLAIFAFAISFLPWFSSNPYDNFVATNWFFGPYGWQQWFWLVSVGVIPFFLAWGRLGRNKTMRRTIAVSVIMGYLHNATVVWALCHGKP